MNVPLLPTLPSTIFGPTNQSLNFPPQLDSSKVAEDIKTAFAAIESLIKLGDIGKKNSPLESSVDFQPMAQNSGGGSLGSSTKDLPSAGLFSSLCVQVCSMEKLTDSLVSMQSTLVNLHETLVSLHYCILALTIVLCVALGCITLVVLYMLAMGKLPVNIITPAPVFPPPLGAVEPPGSMKFVHHIVGVKKGHSSGSPGPPDDNWTTNSHDPSDPPVKDGW